MKREVCAMVALVSMVATVSLQLMKLPTLSNIALVVALTAWWKSGFRLHIEDEEQHRSTCLFRCGCFIAPGSLRLPGALAISQTNCNSNG